MDDLDKQLLDIIQSNFPLVPRPYEAVGKELRLTEAEVLARVRALREKGVIRRIGGNFQSGKLGWHSTLCAARVPEDRLDEFIATVNAYPGVTHNYLRAHSFNVWFTFIGPNQDAVRATLQEIRETTGIDVLYLPTEKLYKIKVDFKMKDGEDNA
ncbi:AsnC family transcriptional regulator [Desulfocurvibacter africanus]|uniref:siroheme decarboxylase n=1 Tax=Desulfocurvibacter africanus subsp. africanus str. Walvis Bay TaxID=690850 RepID=F3Z0E8_DESAF|nr:AsnC family transcriptional regulator [Desulfocurvibacter africanus]EGJ50958.1 putative transcriptional regulator, AsnC family [Desulfocurvibacter africanus subsp. africanus str. Walvis Bay]